MHGEVESLVEGYSVRGEVMMMMMMMALLTVEGGGRGTVVMVVGTLTVVAYPYLYSTNQALKSLPHLSIVYCLVQS